MIEWFVHLPIENQTWIALSVGWLILATSAAIREKTPPGECRNWARLIGVLGVLVLSLQTIHATMLAERFHTELMVRKEGYSAGQTEAVATQIADPVRVVVAEQEYQQTIGDRTISLVRFSDGRFGPLSISDRRSGRILDQSGGTAGGIRGRGSIGFRTGDSGGHVSNEQSLKF